MPSLIVASITPESRLNRWLNFNPSPLDEPGQPCINEWLYRAAMAAAGYGVEQAATEDWIRSKMNRREKSPTEVSRSVARAYGSTVLSRAEPIIKVPEFNAELLVQRASLVPPITNEWLQSRSPMPTDITPTEFLDAVFQAGESVFVTTDCSGRSFEFYHRARSGKSCVEKVAKFNTNGMWYCINPFAVEGRRIDDNLASCRHLLLESDCADRSDWLRVVVQLHAPVVAIYESGNKSTHVLIRLDTDRAGFAVERERYIRELCPLGADHRAMTASRLSRLPNVVRADNGRLQKLLYCNPAATGSPIFSVSHRSTVVQLSP